MPKWFKHCLTMYIFFFLFNPKFKFILKLYDLIKNILQFTVRQVTILTILDSVIFLSYVYIKVGGYPLFEKMWTLAKYINEISYLRGKVHQKGQRKWICAKKKCKILWRTVNIYIALITCLSKEQKIFCFVRELFRIV